MMMFVFEGRPGCSFSGCLSGLISHLLFCHLVGAVQECHIDSVILNSGDGVMGRKKQGNETVGEKRRRGVEGGEKERSLEKEGNWKKGIHGKGNLEGRK